MEDITFIDILDEAAQKSDEGPSVELLQDTWTTLVGDELARLTEPLDYNDGTLRIGVASESWKRELMYRRGTIITRVNGVFPWRVSAVEFEVAQISKPDPQPPTPAPDSPSGDTPVDEATEAVLADVDVRLKRTLRKIRQHMLDEKDS